LGESLTHYIHNLDPILFSAGPITVRWYGLMYLVGYAVGYFVLLNRYKKGLLAFNSEQIQELITYLLIGMILGARLVYVLVYDPMNFLEHPEEIIMVWKGGLSFHGAAIGFIYAIYLYGKKTGVGFFHISDSVVLGAAQGIIWGRLGNFINGELFGRTGDVPWAVIFPGGGDLPRHPSQLYQALGEGLCVFLLLLFVQKIERKKGMAPLPLEQWKPEDRKQAQKGRAVVWKRTGVLGGAFLILYGVARFIVEFFREPDPQLGYFFGWMTMGQILCLLMIFGGGLLLHRRIRKPVPEAYPLDFSHLKS